MSSNSDGNRFGFDTFLFIGAVLGMVAFLLTVTARWWNPPIETHARIESIESHLNLKWESAQTPATRYRHITKETPR